ncbi:hypothetical protein CSUB01_12427 [Colletotrichum sublineola]|uniref:Tc1-like transposase DDE domain-containing protein n=1 Tax=Colletotrichum sublineola TaxID=1173701 RepID=A0A066WY02_COLSU|nr:hypothetical protein CSUB01_12427 [Colletotrichum sublineola]
MEYQHHDTPKKSQRLGIISYLEKEKLPYFKNHVFDHVGVSKRQGWDIISKAKARRHHNDPSTPETRGRKKLLNTHDIQQMEKTLWTRGFEARALTWQALAVESGVYVSCGWRTIQRAMGTHGWRKCVACDKGWVSKETAARRVRDAKKALELRPNPQDWYDIRFSDEVHFSLGPQGKLRIIRKPGERYCPDCIQEREPPQEKHLKRLHAWAAVGYGFKSPLIFYEVPSNKNGKMSLQVYRDKILEPVVGSWIDNGEQFVLEEDGDSGHGTGAKNIVRVWKEERGLKRYFNTPGSPDLSIIENCWKIPKAHIAKYETWDEDALKNLAIEGWGQLEQSTIDNWVRSMPQRMRDVIAGNGRMTGH